MHRHLIEAVAEGFLLTPLKTASTSVRVVDLVTPEESRESKRTRASARADEGLSPGAQPVALDFTETINTAPPPASCAPGAAELVDGPRRPRVRASMAQGAGGAWPHRCEQQPGRCRCRGLSCGQVRTGERRGAGGAGGAQRSRREVSARQPPCSPRRCRPRGRVGCALPAPRVAAGLSAPPRPSRTASRRDIPSKHQAQPRAVAPCAGS